MPDNENLQQPDTPPGEAERESPPAQLDDAGEAGPQAGGAGWARTVIIAILIVLGVGASVFTWYYVKFARRVEAHLRAGPFSHTVNVYSAAETVAVGDAMAAEDLIAHLRDAGYGTSRTHRKGWYNVRPDGAVEIFPGPKSYFDREQPGVVHFAGGKISRIVSLDDNTERPEIQIEPLLLTNVSSNDRAKRRMVTFAQIPWTVVQALTSAEDKHFFRHSGIDLPRLAKAAYLVVREGRKDQGGSTLTMQLARGLWLHPEKSFRRKAQELLITLHLETRLSKEQIFEIYCNQVYLGRRDTFSIKGFGEGARVYFGKDVGDLTILEAATLAGMVQRPSYFNPFRYPERVRERRNVVLAMMRQNGHLTEEQRRELASAPLGLSPGGDGPADVDAQYFVDRVNDQLQARFGDRDARVSSVYTTLDPKLQRAAVEAVAAGMENVDKLLARRHRKDGEAPQAQVALVAMDPRTGEVKAMVGGRDYGESQLDRVLALRQPGSVFKPFVFAAALNTAVEGGSRILTPASTVVDEPTVFHFNNDEYEPQNYGGRFLGRVTLRRALASSLNVAAIRVAEAVGYEYVVAMARRAGIRGFLQPTPAIALGAYEATPFDIAAAYTVFANQGVYTHPTLISMARSPEGATVYRHVPERRRALDPRVAYLIVDMMEDVVNRGSGAGVRARGFRLPAAGKTGTSRDSWFAGFTSELLCVVWVGYDDHRDIHLEGSKGALPIWTEFMKKAHQRRPYRQAKAFETPRGIVSARICNVTGELATPYCGSSRRELFIDGSQPRVSCRSHNFVTYYAERIRRAEPESADRLEIEPADNF